MKLYEYDVQTYNFPQIIAHYLQVDDLSGLRSDVEDTLLQQQNSLYKNMEQASHYQRLYEQLNGPAGQQFYATYERFVREVIQPQYEEPIFYQKKPSHRILFYNNPGESRFHRDIDYGHSAAEINYSVPQTDAFDTNTFWIESQAGKEDYTPVNMKLGQYVRFHGATLRHGAKANTTGKSRVSFDFRVMPLSQAPAEFTDMSNWKEKDKDNPLFQNAHNFVLCKQKKHF